MQFGLECSPGNLDVSLAHVAQERKQIFNFVLYCSHTGPACPPQGRSRAQNGSGEGVVFVIIQTASFWKLLDLIRRGATTLPHRTCSSYRNVFPQWELHSPLPFVRNSVSVFCLYFLACVPHSRSPPTSPVFGEIFSDELYIVLALHIIFFSKLTQSWSLIQIQPFIPW